MRPLTLCIAIAICFGGASWAAVAQTALLAHPNFSGVWVMDATRSESAAEDQAANAVIAITHTESLLKVETMRDGKKEVATYPIQVPPTDAAELSAVRRAYWNGPMLVDEGSVDINSRTIGYREARTQGASSDEMIVETTLKIEHGYEVKGAQTVVTGKNVYLRRR
jgi:hypothetical protein